MSLPEVDADVNKFNSVQQFEITGEKGHCEQIFHHVDEMGLVSICETLQPEITIELKQTTHHDEGTIVREDRPSCICLVPIDSSYEEYVYDWVSAIVYNEYISVLLLHSAAFIYNASIVPMFAILSKCHAPHDVFAWNHHHP